ncbi:hypothetical protein AQUCO_03700062v1 [Aquilegia coerulea]|uniref:Protein kinase domain-containing protein n=1 Tax=Aquilegia coerulea TaxID=218851 RepID=A0A2G5CTJ5_AQUCA|nr:hypothetical protein AQUCO_03700062v1 [Aquilegia coerulea]PIA34521.1 hypothetical protein AQUCO_03700062v1 [Aquilegia coerulea]
MKPIYSNSTSRSSVNEFYFDGMEGREHIVSKDGKRVFVKVKDSNSRLTLHSYKIMEPSSLAMSTSTLPAENTLNVSINKLDGEFVKECVSYPPGSTLPCTHSCSTNDAGFMVEDKLKLKEYEKSKLSVVGGNGQWQNLYSLVGGFGNGNLHGNNMSKDKGVIIVGGEGNEGKKFLPDFRMQKIPISRQPNQSRVSHKEIAVKPSTASGFSQFLVKNAMMEKESEYKNSEPCERFGSTFMEKNNGKETLTSSSSLNYKTKSDHLSLQNVGPCPITPTTSPKAINLREWLKPGFRIVNKAESMHIFTQIVKLVDMAHSQKVALQDIRPSCFELLPSNKIKYVAPMARRKLVKSVTSQGIPFSEHHMGRKRNLEQDGSSYSNLRTKHVKFGDKTNFDLQHAQSLSTSDIKCSTFKAGDITSVRKQDSGSSFRDEAYSNLKLRVRNKSGSPSTPDSSKQRLTYIDSQLEDKWYTSPEELSECGSTFFSNIHSLGVLLFELLCCCDSLEVHAASMADLRNRILPPTFLSENPNETGLCLWLLHPEPSSRPTTREVLQSVLTRESQEQSSRNQQSSPCDNDDAESESESELLLYFLAALKNEKQNKAFELAEDIGCLEADLKEVAKRHLSRMGGSLVSSHNKSSSAREVGFVHNDHPGLPRFRLGSLPNKNESGLARNIGQLETAYFSMRSQVQLQDTDTVSRSDIDLIENRDILFSTGYENEERVLEKKPTDRLGAVFDGLCKYARYSKFEQRAVLRNGDLLNSANVICSLSFDRDEDYFAAAGVSKKIKIFEFDKLFNDTVDIHYPVIEMIGTSKFSCVCWNNYIKNYLVSSNYDGNVQLWDASTGQVFSQYMEHTNRVWSVDFSQVDPMKLASGSDDGLVKLWSINEQKSISTIRNIANICCVQFSPHSTNLLAFGTADYKIYGYDLRNTRVPWCTIDGHRKAVSYVKFLDSATLVSASTDNTLKLWDLNKTSCTGLSSSACSLTLCGHTNEKNFVGLSVSGGYIACGSETNEVFAYHRSLPMPITSSKFGSIDPITGQETYDDYGQFVSSVCWKGESNMVVTANSTGSIKVLQLVE